MGKKTYVLLLVVTLCVLFFSLFNILLKFLNTLNEKKEYKENDLKKESIIVSNNLINDYQVEFLNDEIVGNLKVLNSNINVILVQTKDNTFYLNHSIDKEKNKMGSVFIDYRVDLNKDKKIIIYGHNSRKNEALFKDLDNYQEESYYNEHKNIELTLENGTSLYEVFSVIITNKDFEYLKLEFNEDEEYLEHLNYLKNNSIYETNVKISSTDEIITIQTCIYLKEKAFIIVNARKVK